ncbi:hypothetical protein IGI04_006896, partial [Brassica rapa subsp. trilocularis]
VKGISQLRLNHDTMETRVKELGAGGLAQSAGNSWGSAQSSERCVLVRISVGESGTVTGRADGPGAGRFDQMGLRLGIGSGQAPRRMDLRQKDKEKAKEKEKEVSPGDRTPKVRGVAKSNRTRPRMMAVKEATGASGAVGQDGAEQTGVLPAGTIPTTVLPALVEQVDNATGLPVGPTLPTEVNETNVDERQEQVHGDDTGSSNVGAGSGQNVDANNVWVTGAEEVIEPTIRGLVEAMQVMGAQIASLTQAFTPLVNSSVGQANPPVRVAAGVTDVKGISQLRLNQDTMETRVKELGAGGLAQSAGNSWRSAQSSERCVLVRISVGESGTVTGRADGPGAGRFDQMGLRLGIGSGQAPRDQKWTVVREKHHEDRGHGKMCGDWVDSENCVIIVAYCATCELMRF